MPIPVIPPAVMYAGAYVAGQCAGIAVGTAIVKTVFTRRAQTNFTRTAPTKYFDLGNELDALGMKNPFV